jgi:hypothetical protein
MLFLRQLATRKAEKEVHVDSLKGGPNLLQVPRNESGKGSVCQVIPTNTIKPGRCINRGRRVFQTGRRDAMFVAEWYRRSEAQKMQARRCKLCLRNVQSVCAGMRKRAPLKRREHHALLIVSSLATFREFVPTTFASPSLKVWCYALDVLHVALNGHTSFVSIAVNCGQVLATTPRSDSIVVPHDLRARCKNTVRPEKTRLCSHAMR